MKAALEKCKTFLEAPYFEEYAEFFLSALMVLVGAFFALSALAHLNNPGDVIIRLGFGGVMVFAFYKVAKGRYTLLFGGNRRGR